MFAIRLKLAWTMATLLACFFAADASHAQTWVNNPISAMTPGDAANDDSGLPMVSDDGNFVAYQSGANNLVAGQIDATETDVFLYDRIAGATRLVSHAFDNPLRSSSPGNSRLRALSATGAYVLFESTAPHLLEGETAGFNPQVFLHNRTLNTNLLLSRAAGTTVRANGQCFGKTMDRNAFFVVMACSSTNLQANVVDTNNGFDLYRVDTSSGLASLITHTAGNVLQAGNVGVDGFNTKVQISDDGRWIAFGALATDYVVGQSDSNNAEDVFLYDAQTGNIQLVSHLAGANASSANVGATLVGLGFKNGEAVVHFNSVANILVSGGSDVNGVSDVFEFNQATNGIRFVSHAQGLPNTASNGASFGLFGSSSLFGKVIFQTRASNILNNLTGALTLDVMRWDSSSDTTVLISHADGNPNARVNAEAFPENSNLDGTSVVFASAANNVINNFFTSPTNSLQHYRWEQNTNTNHLLTHTSSHPNFGSNRAAATNSFSQSSNGNFIALASGASDLAGTVDNNGLNDIYLHETTPNTSRLVTRAAFALPASVKGGSSTPVSITPSGSHVLLNSNAFNLYPDQMESRGVGDFDSDVFIFNVATGEYRLASYFLDLNNVVFNVPANAPSTGVAISDDGNHALFHSTATNLVLFQIDTSASVDVFLFRDGTNYLVSRAAGTSATAANGSSTPIDLSADGRYALFHSTATNLVNGISDTNTGDDVYLFDAQTNGMTLVSKAVGANATANGFSRAVALTPDGRHVLYYSRATNLVAGFVDGNGAREDVYVFDRTTGNSRLISRVPASAISSGNNSSLPVGISDDGQRVLFSSNSTNLVNAVVDNNNNNDVFVYDGNTASVRFVSRSASNPAQSANGFSSPQAISGNGNVVLFGSFAADLVNPFSDPNGAATRDYFLYYWQSDTTQLFSRSASDANTTSQREWFGLVLSADGESIGFSTSANNVIAGVNPGGFGGQVYRYRRSAQSFSLISHRFDSSASSVRDSFNPRISNDGARIAYASTATDLVNWVDLNDATDAFLANLVTGFVVTPSLTGNGTVAPAGPQIVAPGGTMVFTLNPGLGQQIGSASGCGGSLSGNTYTTGPVNADCTVTIQFVPLQFTLTYNGGAQGTIQGTAVQIVNYGSNGTQVTAIANLGFEFNRWSDGNLSAARTESNVTANLNVTAEYRVRRYQLLYSAGAGGTIDGQALRLFDVDHGANGPTVNAMPNAGQSFVRWSDGNLNAQRTDLNVLANINVQAEFAPVTTYTVTPTIGANGNAAPNTAQQVNSGQTTFFDLTPNAGYRIGSVSGCNGSLVGARYTTGAISQHCTVTITFNRTPVANNSSMDAAEDGGSYGGVLLANDDDAFTTQLVAPPSKGNVILNPNNLNFTYTPSADANGSDSFTFRINDGVQNSNTATVTINIAATNDPPSFTLSPAELPEHAPGTSGAQTRNNILTNLDFGPPDEDGVQSVSSVEAFEFFDPSNILSGVSISNAGVLNYTLTGNAGEARVNVSVLDSGGFANGGNPRSNPQTLTIRVQNAVDLQISKTNGVSAVLPNQNVVYEILVANAGPYAVTGAMLNDPIPAGLGNVLWSCNSVQAATCPQANGSGAISHLVLDLPVNGVLRFLVTGTVTATLGSTLTNTATITAVGLPSDFNDGNNSAVDSDPVAAELIMRDGFETQARISVKIPAGSTLYQ